MIDLEDTPHRGCFHSLLGVGPPRRIDYEYARTMKTQSDGDEVSATSSSSSEASPVASPSKVEVPETPSKDADEILRELSLIEEDQLPERQPSDLKDASPAACEEERDTVETLEERDETESTLDLAEQPLVFGLDGDVCDERCPPPPVEEEKVTFLKSAYIQSIRQRSKNESYQGAIATRMKSIDKIKNLLVNNEICGVADFSSEETTMQNIRKHEIEKSIKKIKRHLGHDFNQTQDHAFTEPKALIIPSILPQCGGLSTVSTATRTVQDIVTPPFMNDRRVHTYESQPAAGCFDFDDIWEGVTFDDTPSTIGAPSSLEEHSPGLYLV